MLLENPIVGHIATAIGHLSFLLSFFSWMQRGIIKLRMLAVASLSTGLIYNWYIHLKMPEGEGIELVLFWLTVFLAQNIWMLISGIRDNMEVPLKTASKELLVHAFPTMHTADWKRLEEIAEIQTYKPGDVILNVGEPTKGLSLLASGVLIENRDGVERICEKGSLWGEITMVLGEDFYNSSPVSILAKSEAAVYFWSYEKMKHVMQNQRLFGALMHGFVYSAGMKHALLWSEAKQIAARQKIKEMPDASRNFVNFALMR